MSFLINSTLYIPPQQQWNPADKASTLTLSNSNRTATKDGTAGYASVRATVGKSSGKWYYEVKYNSAGNEIMAGVGEAGASLTTFAGNNNQSIAMYGDGATHIYWTYNAGVNVISGASLAVNDICNIAFDASTGKCWVGKNGTWLASGDPASGSTPIATLASGGGVLVYPMFSAGSNGSGIANFQSADLVYTPPSGFSAWL